MAAVSERKFLTPQAYDTSDYSFASISNETYPVGKGSSNDSFASIGLKTGSNAKTYIRWPFDLSTVPANASINSVSCDVKVCMSDSLFYVSSAEASLVCGTSRKGTASSFKFAQTDLEVLTLSAGTWTREELSDCKLQLQATRGTSQTTKSIQMFFYGADLTVVYTYQSEKFMLKLGGAWHDIARTFKKVSGIWVEQTELSNVIEDGVRYKNGGE